MEKLGVDNLKHETTASTPIAPYNLLPCSNEIWLPAEDSLLNIESETVIPETALSSQIVLDYEYKATTIPEENLQKNSIRYGTYKNKTISSARSELKPNGVVLIRAMKTAVSKE